MTFPTGHRRADGAEGVCPPLSDNGGGGRTAFTGADVSGALGVAAVLLVAGGLLVLSTRKRRAGASQ